MILVVLAIGLVLAQVELFQYSQKDSEARQELERVGNTASQLLVASKDFSCLLVEQELSDRLAEQVITILPNCVTFIRVPGGSDPDGEALGNRLQRTGSPILKQDLGIPEEYDCSFSISFDSEFQGSDPNLKVYSNCKGDSEDAENVFASDRTVAVLYNPSQGRCGTPGGGGGSGVLCGDSTISKSQLYNCVTSPESSECKMHRATISLKVWKE